MKVCKITTELTLFRSFYFSKLNKNQNSDDLYGQYFALGSEPNPFWIAVPEEEACISRVEILNRGDGFSKFLLVNCAIWTHTRRQKGYFQLFFFLYEIMKILNINIGKIQNISQLKKQKRIAINALLTVSRISSYVLRKRNKQLR